MKLETQVKDLINESILNNILPLLKNESLTGSYKIFTTECEAIEWGVNNYGRWEQSLTEDLKHSISCYKGNRYIQINRILRGFRKELINEYNRYENMIKDIDNALCSVTAVQDIIAFRWITYKTLKKLVNYSLLKIKAGKVLMDTAFISTSLIPENNQVHLLSAHAKESSAVLLIIRIPKGTRGAYVSHVKIGIEDDNFEAEFLLHRGQNLIVKKVLAKKLMFCKFKYVVLLCDVISQETNNQMILAHPNKKLSNY